jgi:hypothetical protein
MEIQMSPTGGGLVIQGLLTALESSLQPMLVILA